MANKITYEVHYHTEGGLIIKKPCETYYEAYKFAEWLKAGIGDGETIRIITTEEI